MKSHGKSRLRFIVYLLVCVALIHTVVTIFYIIPFNPVTAKYNRAIKTYMDPIFSQNWQLFAPSPISHNYSLLMKVDYKSIELDSTISSEWIDISTSLITSSQNNLISPYNKLVRIPMSAIHQSFHQDEILFRMKQKSNQAVEVDNGESDNVIEVHDIARIEENSNDFQLVMDNTLDNYREQGTQFLYRYSFAMAQHLFPTNEIESVQLRIIISDTIPFSERKNEEYKVLQEYFDLPNKSYQFVMAPF